MGVIPSQLGLSLGTASVNFFQSMVFAPKRNRADAWDGTQYLSGAALLSTMEYHNTAMISPMYSELSSLIYLIVEHTRSGWLRDHPGSVLSDFEDHANDAECCALWPWMSFDATKDHIRFRLVTYHHKTKQLTFSEPHEPDDINPTWNDMSQTLIPGSMRHMNAARSEGFRAIFPFIDITTIGTDAYAGLTPYWKTPAGGVTDMPQMGVYMINTTRPSLTTADYDGPHDAPRPIDWMSRSSVAEKLIAPDSNNVPVAVVTIATEESTVPTINPSSKKDAGETAANPPSSIDQSFL